MTYIAEARVSGNHAAMDKSLPAASGGLFKSSLTIWNILRAGVRRRPRREERLQHRQCRIPKAGYRGQREIRARSLVLRVH
jgi:hypothetical protein